MSVLQFDDSGGKLVSGSRVLSPNYVIFFIQQIATAMPILHVCQKIMIVVLDPVHDRYPANNYVHCTCS